MGEELTYQFKKRNRNISTIVNLRYNLTKSTERKLDGAVDGLNMYRDIQCDEINYTFNEIIKTLNKRREFLIS